MLFAAIKIRILILATTEIKIQKKGLTMPKGNIGIIPWEVLFGKERDEKK